MLKIVHIGAVRKQNRNRMLRTNLLSILLVGERMRNKIHARTIEAVSRMMKGECWVGNHEMRTVTSKTEGLQWLRRVLRADRGDVCAVQWWRLRF